MKKQGFTLVELLVVIAIIGLLSTLAVIALGRARQHERDSSRLLHLGDIQTALEGYFSENNAYPKAENQSLGVGDFACLDSTGFHAKGNCSQGAYMPLISSDPKSNKQYIYNSGDGSSYTITASLEGGAGNLDSGMIQVTPSSITNIEN